MEFPSLLDVDSETDLLEYSSYKSINTLDIFTHYTYILHSKLKEGLK